MSFAPEQIIAGKYRLTRHLARGGMGAVWRAHHLDLGIDVALKVLRADVLGDEKADERFRREARAAAQLESPHVVQVRDYGVDGAVPYLVMELLEGEDLEDFLTREQQVPLSDAVDLVREACDGLSVVHERGIVHRDIKPSNLFLARQGARIVVKLLDFGIAKAPRGEDGETTQGLVFGSPAYMSPEQARGREVDRRSDLWSLAAVFYRLVTGRPPFTGATSSDIVVTLCTEDPRPPSKIVPELDARVDEFVRRALSRDPAQRPQSADELSRCLGALVGASDAPTGEARPSTLPERVRGAGGSGGGRVDETAPLAATRGHAGESEERPIRRSNRAPAATVPWALTLALILATIVGTLWLLRAPPRVAPVDAPSSSNTAVSQSAPQPVVAPRLDSVDGGSVDQPSARPKSAQEPSPVQVSTPQPQPQAPPRHQPSQPQGPQPQPSQAKPAPRPKPPQERDPVFGLPVETPR